MELVAPTAPAAFQGSPWQDRPLAFTGQGFDGRVLGFLSAISYQLFNRHFRESCQHWEVTVRNGKGGCTVLPSQGREATEHPASQLLGSHLAGLILAALTPCFLTVQASWSQQLQALLLPQTITLIFFKLDRLISGKWPMFLPLLPLARRDFWKLVSLLRP